MSDLVVIVPSRGRPGAVAELAKAFNATCTAFNGQIEATRLVFALDTDDPAYDEYVAELRHHSRPVTDLAGTISHDSITQVLGQNRSMVQALNRAAVQIASRKNAPTAIGFMGDDHRPISPGWDAAYLEALRKLGTGIVYGNDLVQGERIPTQCAMTSDIIRTLGYMAPPELRHLYVDDAWLSLGRALESGRWAGANGGPGITYLPGVIVQHLHPVAGTAEMDEGYARVNSPEMYARDKAVYERWLRESLPAAAARLRAVAFQ